MAEAARPRVLMLTRNGCGMCHVARQMLAFLGIGCEEHTFSREASADKEAAFTLAGRRTFPFIFFASRADDVVSSGKCWSVDERRDAMSDASQ